MKTTYQSVACQDSTRDAASTASEFSCEKVWIAFPRPTRAWPRCSKAILPTMGQPVMLDMCSAEKAMSASMTKRCVAPIPMILETRQCTWTEEKENPGKVQSYVGIFEVHKVKPLASRTPNCWLIDATW